MSHQQVLLTGFEPFNGSTLNPSQQIVARLANDDAALGVELHTALLPVDTEQVGGVLLPLLDRVRPTVVVHVGESAKADRILIERLAVNLLDFDCADNAGRVIRDRPIDPGGPAGRWSTLDVRAIERAMGQAGVPCGLSMSAGTYLCNQTLYLTLGWAQRQTRPCRAGFLHVPSMPEQVASGQRKGPGMALERSLAAVSAAVVALAG